MTRLLKCYNKKNIVHIHMSPHIGGLRTYVLRNNLRREARGRLPTLLLLWPTSTHNIHSKASQRENPEDTTFPVPQVAPNTFPTPSRQEGWMPSGFHQKIIRRLSMVQYVLLFKHLNMIPSILLIPDTTILACNRPQQGHLWNMKTCQLLRPEQPYPTATFRYQRLPPLHLPCRGNWHSQPAPWFINQPLWLSEYPLDLEQEYHEGKTPTNAHSRGLQYWVQTIPRDTWPQ